MGDLAILLEFGLVVGALFVFWRSAKRMERAVAEDRRRAGEQGRDDAQP